MDILDELIEKLNILTKDFEAVIEENKKLKKQLDEVQVEKEILERNSQNVILAIKNRLQGENI